MSAYDNAMNRLETTLGNRDLLIALSTVALETGTGGRPRPDVRLVDACYEDGAFYTVTSALSGKMLQIAGNPEVALCLASPTEGDFPSDFTADGTGENLGWVLDEKNAAIMEKVRRIFAAWYFIANDESSRNTCLLRIRMKKGLWNDAHKGIRKEIDFVEKTAD